ncbi:MAG: hypothetical protein ACOH19_08985 [Rhodoglobus sp.]
MAVELPSFERGDTGKGSFKDYRYGLAPNNARVRMRLAGSNPAQETLAALFGEKGLETATQRRTQAQDAADEPIEIRLFTGARVSSPVGFVPRGLESVVDETFSRLDIAGKKQRIPVEIIRKGGLYRVELLMGETR